MTVAELTLNYPGLLETFEEETRLLTDLYRAVRRQRRYMLHRQVEDMREQVTRIDQLVPRVKATSRRRELMLVAEGLMPRSDRSSLKEWVNSVDDPWRERLENALRSLARVGGRLQSLNFQNFQLARFSLDLAQEEIQILVGDVDPNAGYGSDGDSASAPGRGVVDGRA
jgi:flagellar biosynthesis/type III secretory pathway chaperone